jgi:C4-dicarboxylate-specific signal transduction histidine kinase
MPEGGFVLIYSDITERKRSDAEIRAAKETAEEASRKIEAAYRELKAAQANLIQAEKMASLGQLTAGIAHEIKNPLNFVNNFAGLSIELLEELKQTAEPAMAALGEDERAEVDELVQMLTGNLEKIGNTDGARTVSSRACWSIRAAAAASAGRSTSTGWSMRRSTSPITAREPRIRISTLLWNAILIAASHR